MKVHKVQAWKCLACDAITAAEDGVPEVEEMWACGECDTIYEDRDQAKECCRET